MRKEVPNAVTFFNEDLLTTPTAEFAYYLGYFWADGFFHGGRPNNNLSIEVVTSDAIELKGIFKKIGKFAYYDRHRINATRNYKPQTKIDISNKKLQEFLTFYNFRNKSKSSFSDIFHFLPEELRRHFIRGYFDGDGCIYVNLKNKCNQLSIASTFEQDWSFIIDYFKSKGMVFKKTQRLHRSEKGVVSKSSQIRITSKASCIVFYNNFIRDVEGLSRKTQKFEKLI
jgi:intein-encoded DNA endonuclease-like protein